MARPVDTKGSGKAEKPNGKKQLNASLPEQLVLDFNRAASTQGNGKRDSLLEEVLLSFLAQLKPESQSVRQFYRVPTTRDFEHARIAEGDVDRIDVAMIEREALVSARSHAEEIVKATTDAMKRRGPKQAAPSKRRKKHRRVS